MSQNNSPPLFDPRCERCVQYTLRVLPDHFQHVGNRISIGDIEISGKVSAKDATRQWVLAILQRIAAQAGAHRGDGNKNSVSPHVLRHTFLRKLAEEKGVQYAKEVSGHRSDRYIRHYIKPSKENLAAAIDELS